MASFFWSGLGSAVRRSSRALVMLPLLCAACSDASILRPAGPSTDANRFILFDSLVIMLAIVVPTMIAIVAFAWWFRAGNDRATYRPDFVFSGRIELVVWAIPTLVILFLGGVIWIGSHRLDPFEPIASPTPPLEVEAVALDWKWLFVYPRQGVASVNRLVLPAGVPVHFRLTSASVMNAFFVPRLAGQIYAMHGMDTQLWLRADHPGAYYGRSYQFSGDGFPDMHFAVDAVPADGFAGWVGQARAGGGVLDRNAYLALARQSRDVRPFTLASVDPGLFDAIVHQQLPPAPGPVQGVGGPGVKPIGGH